MKSLKIFLLATTVLLTVCSVNAQSNRVDLKDVNGKIMQYGKEAYKITVDSTNTTLDSLVIATNSVGVIQVTLVGSAVENPGAGVTAIKTVRYKKVGSTLTLGTVTDILATVTDSEISGSTWSITTSANNIIVRVHGKLATTIKWKSRVEYLSR